MKVLVVSHSCVVDINQEPYAWLERLEKTNLHLVAPRTWHSDLRGHVRFERLADLRSPVTALRPVLGGHGSLHFYLGATRCVWDARPDLVFVDEEPWSLCALQFTRLASRLGAKSVFYAKENLDKWLPVPLRRVEQYVFRHTTGAVALTEGAKARLKAKGYRHPVFVIPHGINPDRFYPRDAAVLRDRLSLSGTVIGYVGRLSPEKGVTDLVRAARVLLNGMQPPPLRVLLIGSGPLEGSLRRLIRHIGMQHVVTILPAVPHRDIASLYNCMDVLVLPSRTTARWKEQFGRVLVEAMACGVPVIGSDSGAIPEVTGDGGVVFREGDVNDLAEKIRDLTRPGAGPELSRRARRRVLESYTHARIAERLHDACLSVLDAHGPQKDPHQPEAQDRQR